MRRYVFLLIALPALGCNSSNRVVHLKGEDITLGIPIQLDRESTPVAASPNGSRFATAKDGPRGKMIVTVFDTDTLRPLGSQTVSNGGGTIMFNHDGGTLYVPLEAAYSAWDIDTGRMSVISGDGPLPDEGGLLSRGYWNFDRSIAMQRPKLTRSKWGNEPWQSSKEPGQIALANAMTFKIAYGLRCGFDEFGNAWYGSGKSWMKVDRHGVATRSAAGPKTLVPDQTMDRGSMHLRATYTTSKFKDATTHITCIWLYDDRAVPFTTNDGGKLVKVNQPYQSALVFAGADVFAFGFQPGRNNVYVITGLGNYLVPFTKTPAKASFGDRVKG